MPEVTPYRLFRFDDTSTPATRGWASIEDLLAAKDWTIDGPDFSVSLVLIDLAKGG